MNKNPLKQLYICLITVTLLLIGIVSPVFLYPAEASGYGVQPVRYLPDQVVAGEEFEVTISFTPDETINSVGIYEEAPAGFIATDDEHSSTLNAFATKIQNNVAEIVWLEVQADYPVTISFTMAVPAQMSGTYQFKGVLEYYVKSNGPYFVDIEGDNSLTVVSTQAVAPVPVPSQNATVEDPVDDQADGSGEPESSGQQDAGDESQYDSTFLNIDSLIVSDLGTVQSSVVLFTADNGVLLSVSEQTQILNAGGSPENYLTVNRVYDLPDIPNGNVLVCAYNFGPEGTNFSTPVHLTVRYDPELLPSGAAEGQLHLVLWDGNGWIKLDEIVDVDANTITCSVDHFSIYAVFSPVAVLTGLVPAQGDDQVVVNGSETAPEPVSTETTSESDSASLSSTGDSGGISLTTWLIIAGSLCLFAIIGCVLYFNLRRWRY